MYNAILVAVYAVRQNELGKICKSGKTFQSLLPGPPADTINRMMRLQYVLL